MRQNSTNSGEAIRRSTSFVRFSGSVSARNRRTSSGADFSPVKSSETRRRNAASLAGGLGGTFNDSSRLNSSSSMKFFRLRLEKSKLRSGLMMVPIGVFRQHAELARARLGQAYRRGLDIEFDQSTMPFSPTLRRTVPNPGEQ